MLARSMRLEGEPHRRVCRILSSAKRGCPATAMAVEWGGATCGDSSVREAVCRMWVCGMDTVMVMRRGGCGDRGAAPENGDSSSGSFGSRMVLCFYARSANSKVTTPALDILHATSEANCECHLV